MEGIQVVVIEIVVPETDILVHSTSNFNISMKMLKNNAFFGSTGHFDKEIDLAGSEGLEDMNVDSLKPQNIFLSLRAGSRPTERCLPLARELNELLGNANRWPLSGHR